MASVRSTPTRTPSPEPRRPASADQLQIYIDPTQDVDEYDVDDAILDDIQAEFDANPCGEVHFSAQRQTSADEDPLLFPLTGGSCSCSCPETARATTVEVALSPSSCGGSSGGDLVMDPAALAAVEPVAESEAPVNEAGGVRQTSAERDADLRDAMKLEPGELEDAEHTFKAAYDGLVYFIGMFHGPSGRAMTMERMPATLNFGEVTQTTDGIAAVNEVSAYLIGVIDGPGGRHAERHRWHFLHSELKRRVESLVAIELVRDQCLMCLKVGGYLGEADKKPKREGGSQS